MNILLVEDEAPKQRHIEQFVRSCFPSAEMEFAMSVRGALQVIRARSPDLVIMDMSLPTFDIVGEEGGGRPQGFGGLEVLRIMELEDIFCPIVFLTGYEAFNKAGGQLNLDKLAEEMMEDYPSLFRGIIHYNSAYGDWQARLKVALDGLLGPGAQ